MRKSRAFRPTALDDPLESRVVLSHAHVAAVVSARQFNIGPQVLTGRFLNDLGRQVDKAFTSYARDYNRAWKQLMRRPFGGQDPNGLDALNNYAANRTDLLNRQLAASMSRLAGAGDGLVPTVQDRVSSMVDDLWSFGSVAEARAAGRAIGAARQDVRFAQRDFVFAGLDSGDYVLKGLRTDANGNIVGSRSR